MPSRTTLTILIGAFALSLAVVIGAMPAETLTSTVERDARPRLVRVDTVELTASTREVRLPGVTRAAHRAALSFTIPARVASRPVEEGDKVRAGQILAQLDDGELVLARRSAEAVLAEIDVRLDQARRDESRVARLAEAKAATAEELEKTRSGSATLEAARDAASARVADTARLLAEATLRAPFAGTVTAVKLEPGEWASAGKTVVELSGSGSVEVRIAVPETMHARIQPGSRVRVEMPMVGQTVAGSIVNVSDAAAGAGALFPVIVALEDGNGVVAGLAAEVVIPLRVTSELTVPLAAVLDSGASKPSVFRVEDGVARRVAITVGQVVGDRLTVTTDALSAGDLVAIVGHTALVDGDPVEVR